MSVKRIISTSPRIVVGDGLLGLVRNLVVEVGALVVFIMIVGAGWGGVAIVVDGSSIRSHFGGNLSYWPFGMQAIDLGPSNLKPGMQEYSIIVPYCVVFLLEWMRPFSIGIGPSHRTAAKT